MKLINLSKHYFLMPVLCGILYSCSTGGLDAPKALNVKVCREQTTKSYIINAKASEDPVARLSPDNAKIAFTRIWYPSKATATTILNDPANNTMSDFTAISDPAGIAAGCILALDRDVEDPFVYDLNAGTVLQSDVLPLADTVYPGVIVETLYYEFVINDFTVRWYTMSDGTYQRKDILIKTDAAVSGETGGEFKFAYVSDADGSVLFYDTRQATGSGLNPLIRDLLYDEWDSGLGSSGLLPNGTHLILHNAIDEVDEHNSLYFESGNAPEVINYVIIYNLSSDKGGVEYSTALDADGNSNITFSDLISIAGPRNFDLIPITGAIDYSY